jgi:CheY-like chemotaxis protein
VVESAWGASTTAETTTADPTPDTTVQPVPTAHPGTSSVLRTEPSFLVRKIEPVIKDSGEPGNLSSRPGWRRRPRLAGMRPRRAACDAGVVLRCLIIDDNPRFLGAARALLEREGITVVDVASSTAEALQRAEELRPDVTLVDIHLGDQSGFDLVRRLHGTAGLAASRTVFISTHAEEDYADLVAASPAIGFLPKTTLSARAIRDLLGLPE